MGLTRVPIRNSRPSWDMSTSATRRASLGRGRVHRLWRTPLAAPSNLAPHSADVSIHAKFTARLDIETLLAGLAW